MVLSGWILPDGSEIKCMSCSSLWGHISAIKKHFGSNYIGENKRYVSDSIIDDYVVKKYGWIKVINSPYKYVFYSSDKEHDIITQYENLGYTVLKI